MYRKISAIAISTLIAVGIIAYMLVRVWDNLLIAIQHISLDFLVCAVITCLIAWGLRGIRYQVILKNLEIPVTALYSTACIFVSQTANLIVPARLGDLVRIFILKEQKNATYSEGISSLVVERVFDIATVAILGLISLIFVLDVPLWVTELILVPLILALVFFGFLLVIRKSSSETGISGLSLRCWKRSAGLPLRSGRCLSWGYPRSLSGSWIPLSACSLP